MFENQRQQKPFKVISLDVSNLTADELLSDASGASVFDLADVAWERIVVEVNVITLSGTAVTFSVVTGNRDDLDLLAPVALAGDGLTPFSSGSLTLPGRLMFATAKGSMNGASSATIGRYIALKADVTAMSDLDGTVTLYVEGR